jgi:methylase of polypeptide subunit release factors
VPFQLRREAYGEDIGQHSWVGAVGCSGTGLELSPSALRVARARAGALNVDQLLSVRNADLNEPLPFAAHSFDAVISLM